MPQSPYPHFVPNSAFVSQKDEQLFSEKHMFWLVGKFPTGLPDGSLPLVCQLYCEVYWMDEIRFRAKFQRAFNELFPAGASAGNYFQSRAFD